MKSNTRCIIGLHMASKESLNPCYTRQKTSKGLFYKPIDIRARSPGPRAMCPRVRRLGVRMLSCQPKTLIWVYDCFQYCILNHRLGVITAV